MSQYGKRLVDIVTCDALYLNYPFARHCKMNGVSLVGRVKDERTTLYQEINTLSEQVTPIKNYDPDRGVVSYTYPVLDLHISLDWDIPLHGFKVVFPIRVGRKPSCVPQHTLTRTWSDRLFI